MGAIFSDLFYEDETIKKRKAVNVGFNTNIPIVDIELNPEISVPNMGACIFRWYRVNSPDEVQKAKGKVKCPHLTLVSRSGTYRPVIQDSNKCLLFFVRLMSCSAGQECYYSFQETIPRPAANMPLKMKLNFNTMVGTAKNLYKFSFATYNVNSAIFGPEINAEEKMDSLQKDYPHSKNPVFNFLYRRIVMQKELYHMGANFLCVQEVHKKEFYPLRSKLSKDNYGATDVWNTGENTDFFGLNTFHSRDKLSKVREYKIRFKLLTEFKPEKKETQDFISFDCYQMILEILKKKKKKN